VVLHSSARKCQFRDLRFRLPVSRNLIHVGIYGQIHSLLVAFPALSLRSQIVTLKIPRKKYPLFLFIT
jgi:hypothetical protein